MANKIKAINKSTVHRICSGQVVLTLAVAVKELVENSLDAGATSIDVKLKDYGMETIEVNDNGSGVHPNNFQGLTMKHYTSKINDFSDLESVETFGFRGEALSSLCALSNVTVITRHKNESIGTSLKFDHEGRIAKEAQCARQIGTTVILSNLFSTLPVRQKEFQRHIKREFGKLIQLLNAYCIISTGVKITCTNQTTIGNQNKFLSTQGCTTMKENIASIFGSKQLLNLLEIKKESPSLEILNELKLDATAADSFDIEGLISSCSHGSGRSSNDRQYYFINSRPCEPMKISKLINEIYHKYNSHQNPFVCLNIKTARNSVDINVTPDKRKIFLLQEKLLLIVLRVSIEKLFEKIPSTYNINVFHSKSIIATTQNQILNKNTEKSLLNKFRHSLDKKREFIQEIKSDNGRNKIRKLDSDCNKKDTLEISEIKKNEVDGNESVNSQVSQNEKMESNRFADSHFTVMPSFDHDINAEQNQTRILTNGLSVILPIKSDSVSDVFQISLKKSTINEKPSQLLIKTPEKEIKYNKIEIDNCPKINFNNKKCVYVSLNFEQIQSKFLELSKQTKQSMHQEVEVKFRAKLDQNSQAEEELSKEIHKEMFNQMKIIGQFNLGFVITKLGSDLFIIDQHASDEKYNFETLQKTTTITNQKLVVPLNLELTAVNECILIDNINVFKRNGFDFDIDEKAECTKKIKLTAVPMSRNWIFGKEDIDELIFMLQYSSGVDDEKICRPSRIRSMFASRACRKSVMIGTALNYRDMVKLVNRMSQIEHPWNCPHGRPTMRHLLNLDLLVK